MTQLRPRITPEVLSFIVDTLRHHEEFAKTKESEMELRLKEAVNKIHELKERVQFKDGYPALRELKAFEPHVARLEKWRRDYHLQAYVSNVLARRFERLLDGGKPRYSAWARMNLRTLRSGST